MIYVEARQRLVDWLRRQLIGPAGSGPLQISPLERYPTAVLHPIEPGVSGTDPASTEGTARDEAILQDDFEEVEPRVSGEPKSDHPLNPCAYPLRTAVSVGFSFCVQDDARLLITASAASYEVGPCGFETGQFQPQKFRRITLDPAP